MKRILIALFVSLCLTTLSIAQKSYLNFKLAYGMPILKTNDYNTYSKVNVFNSFSTGDVTYRSNNFSFGGGSTIGLDFGKEINDAVALELGVNYLKSNILEDDSEVQYYSEIIGSNIGNSYFNNEFQGQMLYSNIGIAFSLYLKGNTTLNFKNGAIVAMCSFKETADHKVWYDMGFDDMNATSNYTLAFKPNLSLGYFASGGIEYQLSRNLAGFFDLNLIVVDYKPKEAKFEDYEVLQDQNIFYDVVPDKIEFVDEYLYDEESGNFSNQRLKQSFSFSSFGAKAGLKIYF